MTRRAGAMQLGTVWAWWVGAGFVIAGALPFSSPPADPSEWDQWEDEDTKWFWELPINNPSKFDEAEPRHTQLREMNRKFYGKPLWKVIERQVSRKAPGLNRFVLIAFPRSGSSLLKWWLHRHPDLLMHGEVFNPKVGYHVLSDKLGQGERAAAMRKLERNKYSAPGRAMEAVWLAGGNFSHVGFKLQVDHLPWKVVDSLLLQDPSVKKIVLKRRNLLASYVSFEKGWIHNAWFNKGTSHLKVPLRLHDLENTIRVHNAWYALLDKVLGGVGGAGAGGGGGGGVGGEVHTIYYDDIATPSRLREALPKVFAFLGVDPDWDLVKDPPRQPGRRGRRGASHDPGAQLVKQNHATIQESVVNYEEVMALLRGHPEYVHVLDGMQYQ